MAPPKNVGLMAPPKKQQTRRRGSIDELPGGTLRVRVYAGIDPVTKRQYYLTETIEPSKTAAKDAEKARTRLIAEVDERRHPRTAANVNQLLDKWLEVVTLGTTTRRSYLSMIKNHIRPVLGETKLARLDGEILDSFDAANRRCRARCGGQRRPSRIP